MTSSIRNSTGLTLIEVLIALTILSIALTAIIKCASQNIKNIIYLENRTIATWIANDVINQIRAGVVKIAEAPAVTQDDVFALNKHWVWHAHSDFTANRSIKQINVEVLLQPDDTQLAHLTGYMYVR